MKVSQINNVNYKQKVNAKPNYNSFISFGGKIIKVEDKVNSARKFYNLVGEKFNSVEDYFKEKVLGPKKTKIGMGLEVKNKLPANKMNESASVIPRIKFPQPEFKMDYKTVIEDLKNGKEIDEKWLKNNFDFLKQYYLLKDERTLNITHARDINRNRGKFLNLAVHDFTKEKAEYIKSIMPMLMKRDKEMRIKGLEAIEKYGTMDDINKIGLYFGEHDEEIVRPFVKAIISVGEPNKDGAAIASFLEWTKHTWSKETLILMSDGISKLGGLKDVEPLQKLLTNSDPEVVKSAQAAINASNRV